MAKVSATGKKQASESVQAADESVDASPALSTSSGSKKNGKKRSTAIGGTAVPGAKSMQPKQISDTAPQQQQQYESYNREMRRRMERMGYDEHHDQVKDIQSARQKRQKRLKERREQQLAQIKRSLPGGKVDTSTRRVYIMIAVVAALIILLIAAFVVLRTIGVLH